MSLSFKVDQKKAQKEMSRVLAEFRQITKEAAHEARTDAQLKMLAYLMAFVYGTVPGTMYVRTQTALNSVNADLVKRGEQTYLIMLSDEAPYADAIELGNENDYFTQQVKGDVPQISAQELAYLLDGVAEDGGGDPQPEAFFKRTGRNYQEPGPHVTPAAVAAQYTFMRALKARLNRL